jgi:hypothetical protein
MRRAYVPAEHVATVQSRLKAMFGHDDFEVIAMEAVDALPAPGMIGSSRMATYKALGELESNSAIAQRTYEAALREGRPVDFTLYFEQLSKK